MSDWAIDRSRYGKNAWLLQPSFWAVCVYRYGRWVYTCPQPLRKLAHALYFSAYSVVRLATGIDIPRTADIGPGLFIHHFGSIIIHPQAKIGSFCELRQGVTIGLRDENKAAPTVGDHVFIGAYAQILGDISVGDHAKIGAMTLVLRDVPQFATAVGVPARVINATA